MTVARLGIDFGTSHTVAVIAFDGRPPVPLLFDGSPLLPSAVWADPAGRLVVGRDALHAAQSDPAAFEPFPKRHIDEATLLLGAAQPAIEDVVAAILAHVATEARQVAGGPVTHAALTHPAAWAAPRRARLEAAARRVFPDVTLVSEPIAAASYVMRRAGAKVPLGGTVLVYDFGAGTFDASAVRASPSGLAVTATEGLDDTGGLDVDAAIVGRLKSAYDAATWARLTAPATRADRRARRALWDAARTAKEVLTRAPSTVIALPIGDGEAPIGREELDALARPVLARTVETAARVAGASGRLDGVFLVGGASRMPLAASLLHQALGVPPSLLDQPELVVAEGALYATEPPPAPAREITPPHAFGVVPQSPAVPRNPAVPPPWPGTMPATTATSVPRRRRVTAILAAVTAGVAVLATAIAVPSLLSREDPDDDAARPGTVTGAPAGSSAPVPPSPAPSVAEGVDPCLVGTWLKTHYETDTTVRGERVTIVGPGGGTIVYRADGTFTHSYDGSKPLGVTHDGDRWEYQSTGTISGRYRTRDGDTLIIFDTDVRGQGVWRQNGTVTETTVMSVALDPLDYYCSADKLTLHADWLDIEMDRQSP
ncbi:actin-like ATPase involved in cell morphogenesis [Catenuloplanes nepalensis]|uniref:Actin-like ATPase involved in cell morphogenesis n=1 Tax=Catenuloplanes nepalensis TaxID=587533 RepID=A0ABT9N0F6_9ACTN|nr:Hsp70 family protein [Catenuloplanes nepalensis]MDP9796746.1 actin-like ATPase involved in cell morphogenesis [Catenuloplanes nepalensis]